MNQEIKIEKKGGYYEVQYKPLLTIYRSVNGTDWVSPTGVCPPNLQELRCAFFHQLPSMNGEVVEGTSAKSEPEIFTGDPRKWSPAVYRNERYGSIIVVDEHKFVFFIGAGRTIQPYICSSVGCQYIRTDIAPSQLIRDDLFLRCTK